MTIEELEKLDNDVLVDRFASLNHNRGEYLVAMKEDAPKLQQEINDIRFIVLNRMK